MAISEISEVTPESVGFSGGSEEIVAVNGQNHALLSSIPSFPASSHSTYPNKKQHGNRYSNISKPQVCFGGNVLAQKLISRLVDPERYRKWLGLWAMGGAGKTFTARKIYNDGRIRQHFTGGRYWVTVSKDRKSIGGIHILSKEILGCVVGKGSFSFEDARALLKSRLDKDKVLLVLDDVWDPHTLEHLDLISNSRNGVILVTTRDDNNLKNVMDSNDIFRIPPLSDEDSWKLFSWHAFSAYGNDIPPDLEKVAKNVADECVGLPLPLQVIGSAMVGKSLRQEWEDALKKLRAAYVAHDEYETLCHRLQLSVDKLSEDLEHPRLQDCFFYFAAFPEDHMVDVEHLVNIWIAEGIVGNELQENLPVACRQDKGRTLVRLLVSKSMIQLSVGKEDRIMCKIHDVMRDVAHRNLKGKFNGKHGFVKIRPSQRTCLYAPSLRAKKFSKKWTSSDTGLSVERLSLHSSDLEQLPVQFQAQNLGVLILTSNHRLRALPSEFFTSLSQLKVLDLSTTGIEEISGKIFQSLKSLVLLNLRNCNELRTVSNEIGDLQNLQFVILDGCEMLQKVPRITRLSKLHTFSLWLLRPSINNIRQVLKLQNLKRLRIGRALPDVSPLVELDELEMQVGDSFPRGMSKLRKLKTLHVTLYQESRIPALESLPLLEDLKILYPVIRDERYLALPKSFGCRGAFPCLERMSIQNLDIFDETFTFHHGAMPKIKKLSMSFWSNGYLPSSLTVLGSSLNFLRVEGGRCNVENLEQVFSDPSKFPCLEHLELENVRTLPITIASLPKLRLFDCDIEREDWPQELAQLGRPQTLQVDIV